MTIAGGVVLPKVDFTAQTAPVTSASTLNATASSPSDSQLTVAAQNAPLRVLYGLVRIGAQIANIVPYGGYWVLQCVWGEGTIQSIDAVHFGDAAVPAGVTQTHYLGTPGQTADTTLIAAFASNGHTFSDALPGIAYSVFQIPAGDMGVPQITATIKGLKTNAGAWSDNPAYALADFLTSTQYGLGRSVNAASLVAAAAACDALVGGVKRRTFGLAIDSPQQVTQWVDTLRTYAGCWVVQEGAELLLLPDRPRATDASFTHASGQILSLSALKLRGVAQAPTVVEVRYTDTSKLPWREESVWATAAGVGTTVARRDSQVALPGIQNASQAQREATERLNKLWLADLSCELEVFDEAAQIQLGDVIEVTHPIGLSSKKFRALGVAGDYGRYKLSMIEYDPAAYSDAVVGAPTYPDTNLPNPAAPPALTGLVATEEVYQVENGIYASRIRLTWTAPTLLYLNRYTVEITQAGVVMDSRSVDSNTYASGAVKEGLEYVCKVAIVSSVGAVGPVAQANITAQGKLLIPSPVPVNTFQAFEAGGTVYLQWGQAVDIDIWRYRIKRGTTAQTYAQATQVDLVDALRYQDKTAPVGTWRYWVDVVDSVQQESGTPRSYDVVVTSDASAFLVDSYDQTAPALTNMAQYSLAPTDVNSYYITEDAVAFGTKFSSTLATYSSALANYHNNVTSTWLGEAEDFGLLLGGNWTGTAIAAVINGYGISQSIGLSPDGSSWTYRAGLSQKANARFARLKHESLTVATLRVTMPTQNIRLDAAPREEVASGTSSASGPVTIRLSNPYILTKKITITPQGTTAANSTWDNVGNNIVSTTDKAANIVVTGNTVTQSSGAAFGYVRTKNALPTSGKWYWEVKVNAGGAANQVMVGLTSSTASLTGAHSDAASQFYFGNSGQKYGNGGQAAYGATFTTNDVIGVAYDATAGTITFYKNNVSQGQLTGLTGTKYASVGEYSGSESATMHLSDSEITYDPPTGYLPLPYQFDVYVFDSTGTKIARDFLAAFQGV